MTIKGALKWGYPTNTRTYASWQSMHRRCSPGDDHHMWYADRDITVCERWQSYSKFIEDMGERPKGSTLDRINNDGNYEYENCKWSNQREQHANSRQARTLTVDGKTRTFIEWEELLGLCRGIVHWRVKRGYSPQDCISRRRIERGKYAQR